MTISALSKLGIFIFIFTMILPVYAQDYSNLPGQASSTPRGTSGIVGTWQFTAEYYQPETFVFTADGYFVRWKESAFPDLFPTAYGYGHYTFDGKRITMHLFNSYEIVPQDSYLDIKRLTGKGFYVPLDFYGEVQEYYYAYQGGVNLDPYHRFTFLSHINYRKLPGQWRNEEETLKFMGDGIVYANLHGKNESAQFLYVTQGYQIRFMEIDNSEGEAVFSGTITEFNRKRIVFTNDKDGKTLIYYFEGTPKLTPYESKLYAYWLQVNHRTSMDIIDLMDGVDDWIWVKDKY